MQADPIDIAALLAPLPTGEQGAGMDLRSDFTATSPYQRLRDARAAARAEERTRDAEGDSEGVEAAGWREVLSVGQQVLATQTKDLEIAAWMTEAMVRMHGMLGMSAGARILAGLCEGFWEAGFPQPDEDGLEMRSSPVEGLSGTGNDGTVMQPLRRLPLFRRTDGSGIGLYQWDQAEQTETLDDKRKKARIAAGAPELKILVAEARLDKVYLTGMGSQTMAAIAAWRDLEQVLDKRFGAGAPSVRKAIALLDRMLEVIARLGGVPVAVPDAEGAATEGEPGTGDGTGARAGGGGQITRESALRDLDRIAEYFRRTEPHSPLAYTLEEAVRRGRMSLADLLMEVLPDAAARNGMLERLGIKPAPPPTK